MSKRAGSAATALRAAGEFGVVDIVTWAVGAVSMGIKGCAASCPAGNEFMDRHHDQEHDGDSESEEENDVHTMGLS